jgi:hypothetical protein
MPSLTYTAVRVQNIVHTYFMCYCISVTHVKSYMQVGGIVMELCVTVVTSSVFVTADVETFNLPFHKMRLFPVFRVCLTL